MSLFTDALNKTTKTTTQKSSPFMAALKTISPAASSKPKPISISPFNPNTPGHDEYMTQIGMRTPSTSVLKNFVPALGEVIKSAVPSQDMGTTAGTVGGKPVPSTIPNAFQVAMQTDIELPAAARKVAFNSFIAPLLKGAAQVKQVFGGKGQIDLSKIGIPKVDSLSTDYQNEVDSGIPPWEAFINRIPDAIGAGLGLDAIARPAVLKLADLAQEKTTTPITFKDMQNITTGKENLVKPEVLDAYKTATIEHPDLLGQVRQGTVNVPNAPKSTMFSNFLKNAATRPISEISNIFNKFGLDINTPNTPLLPEKTGQDIQPFAHEAMAENKPFAHEILNPRVNEQGRPLTKSEGGLPSWAQTPESAPFAHEIAPAVAKTAPETTISATPTEVAPVKSQPTIQGQTPSKIAQSIEQKAVEQKLTQGFEGVAGYDPITIKDQAQRASNLMADTEKAMRVIKGEDPLPDGLKGTALIIAAEEHIAKTGDVRMAYELANSPLVSQTSAAAQELRLAAERTPDSLTAKLQEIKKAREQTMTKKVGSVKKATEKIKSEIQAEIKPPKIKDWADFVDALKCT